MNSFNDMNTTEVFDTVTHISGGYRVPEYCYWYHMGMRAILGGTICITGIICNAITLHMMFRGVVKTPTSYQLKWLGVADAIFLVFHFIQFVCIERTKYGDYEWINSDFVWWVMVITDTLPVDHIARSSTIWFTAFIGVYRYLAMCKSFSKKYSHIEQHGRKYMLMVFIIAVIYNMPCIMYVAAKIKYYDDILHPVLVINIPFSIILSLTVQMLLVERKRQRKKRNMQSSQAQQNNISAILLNILVVFIICQFTELVSNVWLFMPYPHWQCSSFHFYSSPIAEVFVAVNSAANPFIYFFSNKSYRSAFVSYCHCGKNSPHDDIEMERL